MSIAETTVDLKNIMPTERKSIWRTAEERRMSDLTRVLEWLERRRGKKKTPLQKSKAKSEVGASDKEEKKGVGSKKKQDRENRKVTFNNKTTDQGTSKNQDSSKFQRPYGILDLRSKLNPDLGYISKENLKKSDLDIKDAIVLESTQRPSPFRRQSSIDPVLQETLFGNRKVNLLREWSSKMPDSAYERKLKSLMEKGTEPKIETAKMLKPEEVLSCRYLRLSKNNIRTLVKLCKDAGLDVDIHPHMVEAEIDSKKVFDHPSTS